MNKKEAKEVLSKLLSDYQAKSYNELQLLLNSQNTIEVKTDAGVKYQIEFQAVWDNKENGNLRIMGSIDDGGLRSLMPLTDDFIISPSGEFLGE